MHITAEHHVRGLLCCPCHLLQVWLIEANVNPAMHSNCQVLQDLVPRVLQSTLGEWGWVGLAKGGHWVSGGGWG